MASKKKTPEEIAEKKFIDDVKLYFGSISGRMAQWGYFNVDPQAVLLSNSSSGGKGIEHGDRLMNFCVSELGLHVVYFKDQEFIQKYRRLLNLPTQGYYAVNLNAVTSLLSKYKLNALESFVDERGFTILINKGNRQYTSKNIVAFPVLNFHVQVELYKWLNYTKEVGTPQHRLENPHLEIDLDPNITTVGRIFFVPFSLDSFRDKDNQPIFHDVITNMKIMGVDGLSCVSLKEFVKKLSDQPFTLKMYLWAVRGQFVLSMTTFENSIVKVDSIRPNILAVPIWNKTVFDNKDVLSIT